MARRATARQRAAFVVMCVGYFLVLLDVTIVNVALPTIAKGLHASVSDLQWVVDGYAIALASVMLGGGTIGDVYGHKRVVLGGLTLFGAASLACGLAPSSGALVGFRVLQGLGAALMLPGTLAVITNAYPSEQERAKAIGVWAAIGSVALPAGPLLGGALIQAASWRLIFLVNVPLVVVAVTVAALTVDESPKARGRRLDLAGMALGAVLLGLVTFAFIEGGRSGLSTIVIATTVAAVLVGLAFVATEARRDDPMLPLSLFRDASFSTANTVAGVMNLCTLGLLFTLTLYLQAVRHHTPLVAGVELLPLFLPLSLIAPLGGRLTGRMGPRAPMLAGLLLAAVGVGLLIVLGAASGYLVMLPALLAWGAGLALLTPAVVAAAVGAVPGDRAGLASAVNNTSRQASGAVGIAAFGALAGEPGKPGFLAGFHLAAAIATALFLSAAILTALYIPARG
ncbi:MAG TPA: MFS transporter [Solirubrobacteraceae bacterium]|nr:MFS transporter [Solirubrobacteraceae bacterium]